MTKQQATALGHKDGKANISACPTKRNVPRKWMGAYLDGYVEGAEERPATCALCPNRRDPHGFYPELCPTCNENEYGNELTGD